MTQPETTTPATPATSQATSIEQSRAVAEVQAAVVVAQQRPRSVQAALQEIETACHQFELADRAFYQYRRGGETVTGPTVHLARELARAWGNVTYGLNELRRDDARGESEMQAWAWDLQTNTRSANTFIVPHRRDTKQGVKTLTDMRDIYENNTNQGSRRVREAIFAVLPSWLVEKAKAMCRQTVDQGGGEPLHERIANARQWLGNKHGVTLAQIERKLGRSADEWTEHDVGQLSIVMRSLHQGEVRAEDEFPPERVTADEVAAPPPAAAATPAELPVSDPEDWPAPATPGTGEAAGEEAT